MVRRREDLEITCYSLSIYGWRLKGVDIPPTPKFQLPTPTKEEYIIEMLYISAYKTKNSLLPENEIYNNQKKRKITLSNLMWS